MRAGLLRETLIFKGLVSEQSPSGAIRKEYQPILTCKASRRKMSAVVDQSGVNAMEQFIGSIVVFQTRYYPTIKENQRVSWQGRDYEIKLLDYRKEDNSYLITLEKLNT